MSFFKRIKQIIGNEPIQRKHLGQYAYVSTFFVIDNDIKYDTKERINTDIYLNVYETNSAKISIENRLGKTEFHLIKLPYMPGQYETFKLVDVINKNSVTIGINKNSALFSLDGEGAGLKFHN